MDKHDELKLITPLESACEYAGEYGNTTPMNIISLLLYHPEVMDKIRDDTSTLVGIYDAYKPNLLLSNREELIKSAQNRTVPTELVFRS